MRLAALVLAGLLLAPLTAHAASINLAWDPNPEDFVEGYIVYWGTSSGVYSGSATLGKQTLYTVTGLTSGVTYYFIVKAYSTSGLVSPPSNEVSGQAPSGLFTDDPLISGVHLMQAVHIMELRARSNAVRARYGLPAVLWTDSLLLAGQTAIKAVHLTDIRSAVNDIYLTLKMTPPVYTNAVLTGVLIKAVHVTELRAALVAVDR